MAITLVKTVGIGETDANVYADLTDLESAAELLGQDISTYDDEQKKSALYVAANQFIDRLHEFSGSPTNIDQSMKLYTDLVTYADAGNDIIQANIEAAILHLKGLLFVDPSEQSAKGRIQSESKKLDVIQTDVTYFEGSQPISKYNTSGIDRLLSKYTINGGVRMMRA